MDEIFPDHLKSLDVVGLSWLTPHCTIKKEDQRGSHSKASLGKDKLLCLPFVTENIVFN